MRATLFTTVVLTAAASMTAAACNDNPAGPRSTGPSLGRVEITGPASIPPGGTAQFNMTTVFTDGTKGDVTHETTWSSSHPSIVSINSTGTAVGGERGEAILSGLFKSVRSQKSVLVLPDGTYRVFGRVFEAGGIALPISGARVETGSGRDALATVTDHNGNFSLYGVLPGAAVRVSKAGYLPVQQTPPQSMGTAHVSIPLTTAGPIASVAGTYTLAITAGGCLPEPPTVPALTTDLRYRTYTAIVSQSGQALDVTLDGADFAAKGSARANRFSGVARASEVRFLFEDWDYFYYGTVPYVAERLEDGTLFAIVGTAVLTPAGRGWTGRMSGTLAHHKSLPGALLGVCSSSTHTFALTR